MGDWIYDGEVFTSEMIGDYIGFVYVLTNIETGRKYIGQKRFIRKVTRAPLKGQKRKRRSIVESDWKTYCGSSDVVKTIVEASGIDAFHREIIHLCKAKGELNYMEAKEQFDQEVLLKPDEFYNGIIQCRINRLHVQGMIA